MAKASNIFTSLFIKLKCFWLSFTLYALKMYYTFLHKYIYIYVQIDAYTCTNMHTFILTYMYIYVYFEYHIVIFSRIYLRKAIKIFSFGKFSRYNYARVQHVQIVVSERKAQVMKSAFINSFQRFRKVPKIRLNPFFIRKYSCLKKLWFHSKCTEQKFRHKLKAEKPFCSRLTGTPKARRDFVVRNLGDVWSKHFID